MAELDKYLRKMCELGGSDLHLQTGMVPKVRKSGDLLPIEGEPILDKGQVDSLLTSICPEAKYEFFKENLDLDFAYEIDGLSRFRCNYMNTVHGAGAVFRTIPTEILTLEQLKLPEVFKDVCSYDKGLVLVTGPTGSGKSTTLAAMINYINENYTKHIITIEDPLEFVHPNKKSVIVQREVGEHTQSFNNALKGAMRADPDIVLVGEMRDPETIKLALSCAAMGLMVFGTLHTNNAPKTIDRVIGAFPSEEQSQIRAMLAETLVGVISQLLCKTTDGKRCAAHEILLKHDALPNLIREGQLNNIRNVIESSSAMGMQGMDGTLQRLFKEGRISAVEAYMKAADKTMFQDHLPADFFDED
jgi:twitching motility protein PilT